jgi:hypothetical protein
MRAVKLYYSASVSFRTAASRGAAVSFRSKSTNPSRRVRAAIVTHWDWLCRSWVYQGREPLYSSAASGMITAQLLMHPSSLVVCNGGGFARGRRYFLCRAKDNLR